MSYSKLSIVIPVYNEINTIHEILRQVSAVEIGLEKEIILVDDCSTDGTRAVLEKIKNGEEQIPAIGPQKINVIFHEQNAGKGGALRTGFRHITGDIMIVQDADLEYDPQDYPKLIQKSAHYLMRKIYRPLSFYMIYSLKIAFGFREVKKNLNHINISPID